MGHLTSEERRQLRLRYRELPIDAALYTQNLIENLSDYFGVFHSLLDARKTCWFRGLSKVSYGLVPGALRYTSSEQRKNALQIVEELKRFLEFKLDRPPRNDDALGWMLVAQHYGLPTRLLDWTHNAAAALFFACYKNLDDDGGVVVLNPLELNQVVAQGAPRIFNPQIDAELITPYLTLGVFQRKNGLRTIAINPTWNNERIQLQQGAFTLHGNRRFALDRDQAASLVYVPILREVKRDLLNELERVGVNEMFIYPEPEHVCNYLRMKAGL